MIVYIVCIASVMIALICNAILRKKYDNLYQESIQDKMFLITLSEFVIHIKEHTDKEIATNDMINAVKTYVNKGLYEVTPVNDNYIQDNAYYSFAEQMFKFVEEMNKE